MKHLEKEKTKTKTQRIIAFDVMRIVAIFAVIWLHFSSQRFYTSFPSTEWEIRNIYDSMVRWGVPVFVMISGALFLDSKKKLSIKRLYAKNILRIICAFLFWSFIYLLYDILATNQQKVTIGSVISSVVKGPFHLWFLKMLLGLYIVAPILKIIANNRIIEKYFLLLALITTFILPWFFKFLGFLNINLSHLLNAFYEKMDIKIALGFTGFFILGHYLKNKTFNPIIRKTIYFLGLISWYTHQTIPTRFLWNRFIYLRCWVEHSCFIYSYIYHFIVFIMGNLQNPICKQVYHLGNVYQY